MKDNLTGRLLQRKTTSQEEKFTGKQSHWKTISLEDNLTGRQPHWKTTSLYTINTVQCYYGLFNNRNKNTHNHSK